MKKAIEIIHLKIQSHTRRLAEIERKETELAKEKKQFEEERESFNQLLDFIDTRSSE